MEQLKKYNTWEKARKAADDALSCSINDISEAGEFIKALADRQSFLKTMEKITQTEMDGVKYYGEQFAQWIGSYRPNELAYMFAGFCYTAETLINSLPGEIGKDVRHKLNDLKTETKMYLKTVLVQTRMPKGGNNE